jgi:histidinol-phosphate/aromatic aminotransferase/cobyric acid decarboxylase-like protein/imidazoleglycerol phosphate dehydratase HisB
MKPFAGDPATLVRPELRRLTAYHLDLSPCRHKLDQNESPFEPPARLKRQVAAQLLAADWARYPDFHADALRRGLGAFHGWPPEGILVGNGSNELLDVCLSALVQPGGEVLGREPSFGLYRMMVLKAGGVPRFLRAEGAVAAATGEAVATGGTAATGAAAAMGGTAPAGFMALPLRELLAEVARQPRRPLVLCSPNNPTGDALLPAEVEALLERQEGPLLLDNAYGEFCRHDYRPLLDRHPQLILLRTFSKAWALAGLRLGYLLADPRLVAELLKVKLPYNLGRAGVLAGRAALAAAPAARRRIAAIIGRREQWRQMLAAAGLRVMPSEANFLLVRCSTPAAARQLRDGLAARGIRVRDVGAYPGLAGCLRVSAGGGAALRATRRALAEMGEGAESAEIAELAVRGENAELGAVAAARTGDGGSVPDRTLAVPAAASGGQRGSFAAPPAVSGGQGGSFAAPPAESAGQGESFAAPPAASAGLQASSAGQPAPAAGRRGEVERATGETRIRLALALDGGVRRVEVGNGFFGHMLEALATHGGMGLEVTAAGDLHVDLHHTVEDIGIAFGEALAAALGERRGVTRFGSAFAPLDEALARAVVDLSGRGFFAYSAPRDLAASWVTADFPLTLVADFFQAVADRGRITLHLEILAARNGHHAAEAAFKAAALALRQAVALRPGPPAGAGKAAPGGDAPAAGAAAGTGADGGTGGTGGGSGDVPSTKGTLTA